MGFAGFYQLKFHALGVTVSQISSIRRNRPACNRIPTGTTGELLLFQYGKTPL